MLKNVIRVKLSNNFKRFKINPDKTVDIESSTCYFLDVPKIPSDSFRSATNFPTILGQYLCLIPISQDRFRIFSLRTTLSVMALVCQIIMTFLSFCWLKETGANIFKGGQWIPQRGLLKYNIITMPIQGIFYRCCFVLWWVSHHYGVAH